MPGWFVWDVVDLDADGRAELLATRAKPREDDAPYLLPWEMDVLKWNGTGLESIYHLDGVVPRVMIQTSSPDNQIGGTVSRTATINRDIDGDGVREVMVEDRTRRYANLQVAPLARPAPVAGGGTGSVATPQGSADTVAGVPDSAPGAPEPEGQRLYLSNEAVHLSSKGEARIDLSCFGPDACAGEISVRSAKRLRRGDKAQLVKLGRGKFKVPSGRRRAVRVRISRYGRALVSLRGKLSVKAKARAAVRRQALRRPSEVLAPAPALSRTSSASRAEPSSSASTRAAGPGRA